MRPSLKHMAVQLEATMSGNTGPLMRPMGGVLRASGKREPVFPEVIQYDIPREYKDLLRA